jgi:hypothetical protein
MKYTATGHKAKAKEQMSTETTDTGHLCKSPGRRGAQGGNNSGACMSTNGTSETIRDHK